MTRTRSLAFAAAAALLLAMVAAFAPIPSPTAAAGLISIRIHNCAATYDGANSTIYNLAADCHDPGAGLTVALSRDNTPVSTMTADANGWLNFANFQTGAEAELTESAPLGFYNRAFCALYLDNDPNAHVYYQYQDPVLQLIKTNQNFDCDFFNIAYVPATPSTVYVNKHNCPVGFDALGADIYGLAGGCNASGTDGVGFTLTDPANASTPATTSGGIASWPNVPTGAITLTETIPSGYESVRVFCNTKNLSGDESGFSEYPATNGAISATTKSGYDFYCDWFDIPRAPTPTATPTETSTETPTEVSPPATATSAPIVNTPGGISTPAPTEVIKARLIIFAFNCPAGYDVLKANADPNTDCTVSAKDAQFTLTGNGISPLKRKITDQNNTDFAPLEAGDYELTETLPAGVTSAFIDHCASDRDFSSYPFKPFARVGSSGNVALNILDGEKLMCVWFNVPAKKTAAAGAAVKITLRNCPGPSVNLSQCTPGASGVEFTLKPTGTEGTATTLETDAGGVASGPVKAGTYKIAETGGTWCLADSSAFDTSANLVVAGDNVDVAIYHCGP